MVLGRRCSRHSRGFGRSGSHCSQARSPRRTVATPPPAAASYSHPPLTPAPPPLCSGTGTCLLQRARNHSRTHTPSLRSPHRTRTRRPTHRSPGRCRPRCWRGARSCRCRTSMSRPAAGSCRHPRPLRSPAQADTSAGTRSHGSQRRTGTWQPAAPGRVESAPCRSISQAQRPRRSRDQSTNFGRRQCLPC